MLADLSMRSAAGQYTDSDGLDRIRLDTGMQQEKSTDQNKMVGHVLAL